MKHFIRLTVIALALVMIMSLAACGGSSGPNETTSGGNTETTENTMPVADPALTDESVIGEWTDINQTDRFVKITKTSDGYEYEDNEGKYAATFEAGILKVKVNDTESANVFYEEKNKNLISEYNGLIARFIKK